jgi:hypothetical protein
MYNMKREMGIFFSLRKFGTGCKIWTHLQRIIARFGILTVNSNKGVDAED